MFVKERPLRAKTSHKKHTYKTGSKYENFGDNLGLWQELWIQTSSVWASPCHAFPRFPLTWIEAHSLHAEVGKHTERTVRSTFHLRDVQKDHMRLGFSYRDGEKGFLIFKSFSQISHCHIFPHLRNRAHWSRHLSM